MTTQYDKAERFRALHASDGGFVIPNPWDVGSARLLAGLGFEALATTSSGLAFALGRVDGEVTVAELFAHCRQLCAATNLPVSTDLENGYGDAPEHVAATIVQAAETGVVGGSIEDYSGDDAAPIYGFEHAVERVQAAVEAARALDFHFTLTARAEGVLHGVADLDDAIRRLQAFEAVGADVLYAPGLTTLEQLRTVAEAVTQPVNVLAPFLKGATVADMIDAGARRISVGGALARAAIAATLQAGRQMQEEGRFDWTSAATSGAEISSLLGRG